MAHGGARAGSGQKPKAKEHTAQIKKAEKRIADRLLSLIDNMFRLADGVKVKETDEDGESFVFVKPPDRQANEYLINRILGKPTERHDVTSGDEVIKAIGYAILAPATMGGDSTDGTGNPEK